VSTTTVGNVLLILSAIPAVASVLVFSRVTWWRSPWGRHVMAYMSAVAVTLILGVCRLVFGDHPMFAALRVVAYISVVVVLWWRLIILVAAYREGSPDDANP
jgi:hypothetical protein